MAPKPSHDTLIHCEACGEDYSSTYRRCPFCGERNDPRRVSGRGDPVSSSRYIPTPPPARPSRGRDEEELDDGYVFDGQDAFEDDEEEYYDAPRPKGGKRLAEKQGGFAADLPPINWPRLITFLCSLVIIVAALIIVFTFIYPQLRKTKDPNSKASAEVSPSPAITDTLPSSSVDPEPNYTPDTVPSDSVPEPSAAPSVPVTTATIVNASGGLRLRSGPGTTYDILGSLYNGYQITVLGPADNGWYNVSYNGLTGYIMGDYISTISGGGSTTTTTPAPTVTNPPVTPTQSPSSSGGNPTVGRTGTIVGADGGLRVRSGPGTTYEVVESLVNGNTVTVMAQSDNGWYQIQYTGRDGATKTGYIMGQYISTN